MDSLFKKGNTMFRTLVLVAALVAVPAFADDAGTVAVAVDAGTIDVVLPVESVDAGVVAVVDAGVPAAIPVTPEHAVTLVKTVFVAVKEGNWWLAAAGLLLLVVGLLRTLGRRFHDWLPDNNIMDKPLIFIYDTKVGGWLLNWLTALAGGIGTAMAAGVPVDLSLWKSVVIISTSGSALLELYKDIKEWWVARQEAKKKAAEEEAAKKTAVVSPPAEPPKV